MSRKSMLSSSSCSRNETSSFSSLKSSSGAIPDRISLIAALISAVVMPRFLQAPRSNSLHNEYGINPQHAERVVQDVVGPVAFLRLVDHQPVEGAVGVKPVDV